MKQTKTVATGEKSQVRTFCAPVPLDPGILADIIANPERDDLRLHAADWLIDHDQEERAEFIQVQVQLARWGNTAERIKLDDGRVYEFTPVASLRRRERKLLFHGDFSSLLQGLPPTVWLEGSNEPAKFYSLDPSMEIVFRRGFVELLACTAADFLAHADALRAATPLRVVTLTTWLEWCESNGRVGLHERCSPSRAKAVYMCQRATMPKQLVGRLNSRIVHEIIDAEFHGIKFRLPPYHDTVHYEYELVNTQTVVSPFADKAF